MKRSTASERRFATRRGFTLIELVLAGTIAALVLVTVVVSLSQIGRAREVSRTRLLAHLRADSALDEIRRDLSSVLRDSDLFHTRVLLYDGSSTILTREGRLDVARDELLIFNSRLEPLGDIDYNGEGGEYETHYRIDDDQYGAALWQRRDAVPDDWPDGGGIATPIAEGVVGLQIMAYDGQEWYEEWDSDTDGLPWGFRVEIMAIGNRDGEVESVDPRSIVVLRSHVAVDRIVPPYIEPEPEVGPDGELLLDEGGMPGAAGGMGGLQGSEGNDPGIGNQGRSGGARGQGGRGGANGQGGKGGGGGRGLPNSGNGQGGGRSGGNAGGGGNDGPGNTSGPFRPSTANGGAGQSKPGNSTGNGLN
ncbi:MAG: hypothetical protein VX672_04425 [Planctomycetota bacterium]|nr:hypothetical protein [Planctomycetota bacterium]